MRKFKVYKSGADQKGGTLFKFTTLSSPPPFLGTWDQIERQRGAGLSDVLTDFKRGASAGVKRGWKTKSLSEAKRGVKRAASDAIYNEVNRQTKKKLKDIFGV